MNDLHELLHDAVAGVEPTDRLDDIRARTADPARAAARPWFYAAGAAVLATAAAVTVVAVLGDSPDEPPTAGHDHHGDAAAESIVPAYFIGSDRLFREYDQVPAGDRLDNALARIQQPADDPDYTTAWDAGTLVDVTATSDEIDVEVAAGHHLRIDELAAQQVVYTVQGALGERLPVRFVRGGTVVLGPLTADPDVLNPVSISDPTEGHAYDGRFVARGRATQTTGGEVLWALTDDTDASVRDGIAELEGDVGSYSPWQATVEVDGLAPGSYTFTVRTPEPENAALRHVPYTDTRTITVR